MSACTHHPTSTVLPSRPSALLSGVLLMMASAGAPANTVIYNVHGYTLEASGALREFDALSFTTSGEVIVAGTRSHAAKLTPGATFIDGEGATLLPGLIDAHGHVRELGESLISLDLRETHTLAEAQARISAHAAAHPGTGWVRGSGWNQVIWNLGRFPDKGELDVVSAGRPAWLERVDGHAGWANSAALAAAGITHDTPDPEGGRIERDARGEPTGVLVDHAMALLTRVIPGPDEGEARAALDAALKRFAEVGLTSVHDMGIGVAEDRRYRDYADHDRLSTRVYAAIGDVGEAFAQLSAQGPLDTYGHDHYALRAVKLYADGALGSRGAALLQPYDDRADSRGLLFRKDPDMRSDIARAARAGYAVSVHAIGDAANRQVLDAFTALAGELPVRGARHRIEHAQVVALTDLPRFGSLGIIASMQPTHATSDLNMAEDRIGKERIKGAYAWRSLLASGGRLACGSDFPVESPNPFVGIHAAVTRETNDGTPVGGWYPEQSLSLKEALRCFTLDAAYAAHQEDMLGSLEPGKWADFVVIDQDLFRMNPHDIRKIRVLQTWVGGRRIYAAP